jgi:predicted DNA-binding mobile mystery protein A
MSSRQLAARLGLSQPAVSQLERSEVAGRIQLNSLRRAAAALDCEFVYALVPRTSLEETLDNRARALARRHLASLVGTLSPDDYERDVDALAAMLRDAGRLWDDRDAR